MYCFPDRAAIEDIQRSALQAMLAELIPHNRFYSEKLRNSIGLPSASHCQLSTVNCQLSLDQFFAAVPFTFKQELVEDQRANPPYGTNLTYPLSRYTRFSQTSGTTGKGLRWLDTPESWSWMVDRWVEVLQVVGVAPSDRLFCAFSFGPFLGFWTAFEAGLRLGCLCIPGGGMSSAARIRTILENDVTVLCCTPTYAMRLAEVAAEEGLRIADGCVRTILTAGEPGACIPATRARIEQLWPGASVRDQHGMTEVGPVTFECPERAGVLHVMETAFLPEVIDPATEQPVPPGGEGELVLTNLGRVGSPLIRYRTGDRVRRAQTVPCACGRYDLALEGGILGRTDDMVIVRSVNLYPSAVEAVVRGFSEVAEYRVEVRTERAMTEVHLEVEPTPECADPVTLGRKVESELRAVFHLRIPVSMVPAGTLPRFELKARRWVRKAVNS